MSSPGSRFAWAATKIVAGLSVYALASLLLFLLFDRWTSRTVAYVLVALAMIVGSLGLTRLLLPALRRIDANTRFVGILLGTSAVFAALLLVAVPFAARTTVSNAFAGVPTRYPQIPSLGKRLAVALSAWIARPVVRAAVPTHASAHDAGVAAADAHTHVAVLPVAANDAGRIRDATTVHDAATHAVDVAVAPRADAAVADARAPLPETHDVLANVSVCDRVRSLFAAELGQGPPDELVVACNDGVHVLWLHGGEGAIVERSRFVYRAPDGLEIAAADPRVADLDGDGTRDLALCAHWTSERGGTRGGDAWWSRGRTNGQFAPATTLVSGECGAIEIADLNNDGHDELLVAQSGNPWQQTNPNGVLVWYARTGPRWNARGRIALRRGPEAMWLNDVDGDGLADLLVYHSFEGTTLVIPGTHGGPPVIDLHLHGGEPPDLHTVHANFDGDGAPDTAVATGGTLRIRQTAPVRGEPITTLARSLDFEQFAVPAPR